MAEEPILICPLVTCEEAGALDLYVSPGGSDAGSGTAADPLATVREALARVRAAGWNFTATIHLMPGDNLLGDGLVTFEPGPGMKLSALRVVGTLGAAGTVTVGAVTVAPSGAMDIDIGVPAAPYSGLRAAFSGGARSVAGSALGTVLSFPSVAPAPVPVPSSSVSFAAPLARLVCGPNGNTFTSLTPLAFEDFDFVVPDLTLGGFRAALMLNMVLIASYVRVVPISGAGGVIFSGGQFAAGQMIPSVVAGTFGLASVPGGAPVQLIGQNCTLALGGTALQDTAVSIQHAISFLGGSLFQRCQLDYQGGSFLSASGVAIRDSPGAGVSLNFSGADLDATEIDNSGGDGIVAEHSQVNLGNTVSGTNGGAGLRERWGSHVTATLTPTLTGAAGDVVVGSLPPAPWGGVPASDYGAPAPEFATLAFR